MSDRPQDQGGSDGQPSGQGGPPTPYPGAGDQPPSLTKGGDSTPAPSYGYGPPSYSGDTPPAQPGLGDQPGYGGQPSYSDQSVPYGAGPQQTNYDAPTAGYDQQGSFTPPPPGPAGGYGAYGPPAGTGPYGSPPPKKKRTGLVIGLIAGGLVVVIALVIGLVAILAGGGGKPSETVQAYLQALSDGDAAKALEQGEKPPDTTFATSDALKAQQEIAKITDIDVSEGYSGSRSARVSATYKFGDKQADESFTLTKIGGKWKLDDVVYPIDLTGLDDVPGLTLMGIDAGDKNKAYVFPGPLVWGSSNEYLSVTESEPDDFTLSPADGSFSFSTLETGLSDAGEKAVAEAVTTFIDDCAKEKSLTPEGCPQREYDYEAVDGTATWKAPGDLSALEYRTSSPVTEVYVSGTLTWSVSYTAEDYDGKRTTKTANNVDGSLYGTVDLTQDPPVYSE
ncbi:Rv0361 family membrane protein [Jatrophihabitans sp. YIM 134969]